MGEKKLLTSFFLIIYKLNYVKGFIIKELIYDSELIVMGSPRGGSLMEKLLHNEAAIKIEIDI